MYESIEELPDSVRDPLPEEAQEIYLEAYNRSWKMYDEQSGGDMGRESVANRDGWAAVRREYTKDEETGEWFPAGEKPEETEEEEGGILDELEGVI